MDNNVALVPVLDVKNGNGSALGRNIAAPSATPPASMHDSAAPPQLTDETVKAMLQGRGLRGWLRAARVVRVLGLFTLYLFLDTYDIRATFNSRMAARLRDDMRDLSWRSRFKAGWRELLHSSLDKSIRMARFTVFRGDEGSAQKEARLEKQAVWLRKSLIDLGPTFIKIGQALGTRADLLPLAYVKELSTLQDQVPAFPTAEAYARIEAEFGRSLQQCYPEIDSEPIASASLGQVYRARLATGEEVAVKVQRLDLEKIISFDVAIKACCASFTRRSLKRWTT
jgi:hypothetical protein